LPIVCIEIGRVIPMTVDKVGNLNNIPESKRSKGVLRNDQVSQGNDSIQISTEGLKAVEEARYAQVVREAPDVRAERVKEIKSRIDDGTYNSDMDEKILSIVADKILANFIR